MSATYLYCVIDESDVPPLGRMPRGLPHTERPRLLEIEAGICLVVATLRAPHYARVKLEQRLQNLEWLWRCAIGHERVVEECLRCCTTIPVKLFTLFSNDRSAIMSMRRSRKRIHQAIARVSACQEWGLRVNLERARNMARDRAARAAISISSGAEFLMSKRQNILRGLVTERSARSQVLTVYERLANVASAACQRSKTSPVDDTSLLDAAFLVPKECTARFRSEVRVAVSDLERCGCHCAFSGPWPPYSFVGSI